MKELCQPEELFHWLHILALMVDTVLLSTSRQNILKGGNIAGALCRVWYGGKQQ